MPRAITVVTRLPKLEQKKRVAAYARVSSGKDAMLHSLSAQVSFYSDLIQHHDDWLYVGVYADEAKTGTKESRPDFQRLIADCHAGKIDMVITKSISRFARNTVTLLQTVRDFKAWGVDIYFEEQNIHTLSSDGELMITILASYAQEESRSVSENQKWRIRKNFEEGIPGKAFMLGYRQQGVKYEIVPEEAELVRRIYSDYLGGLGYQGIANQLNEENVPSPAGKTWHPSVIQKILTNYAYTGNMILQKTYRENHMTKQPRINKGELPMYHVENAHEAIIPMETFRAVLAEKERRSAKFQNKTVPKKAYPFSGMMVCGNCGKNYRRKTTKTGIVWICSTFNTAGKAACAAKQIPEETLMITAAEALGLESFSPEVFALRVSSITVKNGNTLVFHLTDGSQVEKTWKDRSRRESWTEEMKQAARKAALTQERPWRHPDGTFRKNDCDRIPAGCDTNTDYEA
jgi:DNA invertase Pin-like site-specific DNA recombinase